MNKREVIRQVSERTCFSVEDCEKILDAFEEVFTDELENAKGKGSIFDTIYKILNYINNRRVAKKGINN